MKLLLINPQDNNSSLNPVLNDYIRNHPSTFVMPMPSLAMLTIAGLTPTEIDVEYIDENVRNIDFEHPADLIGIGAMTQQATRAYEIADEFCKRGKKVVFGGIHASCLPEEAKAHADSVIIGEAEEVWTQCLSDFRHGQLKEFYCGALADLTKSPTPRYDLLKSFDFSKCPQILIPVQFARGCPKDCSFCAVTHMYGKSFRTKKVSQAINEVKAILDNCRINNMNIIFNNDNPFLNRKFAVEMLKAIAPLNLRWFTLADISIAKDTALLKLLHDAGCVNIGIGFESLDPQVLNEISAWKIKHLASYEESIRAINDQGITVAGSFILGFDHDTSNSFKRVRDFVIKNHVMSKYSIITPFPGTRFYEELNKQGRLIKDIEWRYYNFLNVVHKTVMPKEEIEEQLCRLYEETWCQDVLDDIGKFNAKILASSQ